MKFSIITINYNNKDGLERTVKSVISQTFQDFEYIIIDGGSTDGSVDVIKKFADRIDYWVSEPDKGVYNAMNKGIQQAHGDYLNFMNSGDCYYDKYRLEKIMKYNLEADFVIGRDFHEDSINGSSFTSIHPLLPNSFYFYISTLPHQSAFIKKEMLKMQIVR